jgi:uncharacterized protein with FMN-binding domain
MTGKENRGPQKGSGSSKKIANNLVALGSAAVLTVYTAGYLRTRSAAERFAAKTTPRRTDEPALAIAARVAPPAAAAPNVGGAQATRMVSPRSSPAPIAVLHSVPRSEPTEPPAAPFSAAPSAVTANDPTAPEGDQRTAEPPAVAMAAQQDQYKDGTYSGWGSCRHGDIQASVVVEGGRIVSATIAQCLTRYSCSWIAALPSQVVSRQSVSVDYVSGATQSTDAFADAVTDALSKAK